MLHGTGRRCDGVRRRDFLRVGGLASLGLGLGDWSRPRAKAGAQESPRAKSCILLWLDGGPSHLETFDLKPDAPGEVRGPFRSIATNVAGVRICELLPKTARVTDKLAIIRSMTSPLGEHGIANRYLLTGYKPSPVLDYPSYGAVLAHVRGGRRVLPPDVAIPESRENAGPGFLGAAYRPFATGGDPAKPGFRVRDLDFYPGVTASRLDRRREFLARLERFHEEVAALPPEADPEIERAYRLVTSSDAKAAFDLSREKSETRARYGPRTFGQSCLLARRLVERGVPFVSVLHTGWDTHAQLVLRLKDGYTGARVGVGLVPTFDMAFSALIADLSDRGLLDETLVIAMGEFGRTPKLNASGGRDHWPRVFSIVMAGGGIKRGQVYGASDSLAAEPAGSPLGVEDYAHTVYHLLGIDGRKDLMSPGDRPQPIVTNGQVVKGLLA